MTGAVILTEQSAVVRERVAEVHRRRRRAERRLIRLVLQDDDHDVRRTLRRCRVRVTGEGQRGGDDGRSDECSDIGHAEIVAMPG